LSGAVLFVDFDSLDAETGASVQKLCPREKATGSILQHSEHCGTTTTYCRFQTWDVQSGPV